MRVVWPSVGLLLVVACGSRVSAVCHVPRLPVAAYELAANDVETCTIASDGVRCWGLWSEVECVPAFHPVSLMDSRSSVTLAGWHACWSDAQGVACSEGGGPARTVVNAAPFAHVLDVGDQFAWVQQGDRWGSFVPGSHWLHGEQLPWNVRWSDLRWTEETRFSSAGGSYALLVDAGGHAEEVSGFRATGRSLDLGPELVEVSGDLGHGCLVRGTTRSLSCWGFSRGEIVPAGFERVVEVVVRGSQPQSDVPGSGVHACARAEDGTVACVGDNGCDARPVRLDAPPNGCDAAYAPTMRAVDLPSPARDLALGTHHACAALLDGSVWCWGSNFYGQLGDGTRVDSAIPVRVRAVP